MSSTSELTDVPLLPFTFPSSHQILKKGELQVGEKERSHNITNLYKDIATQIAEKCVDPSTQRPYSVSMIEKAMAEVGFSVKADKTAKSQVSAATFSPHPSLQESVKARLHPCCGRLALTRPSPLGPERLPLALDCSSPGSRVHQDPPGVFHAADPARAYASADHDADKGWQAAQGADCRHSRHHRGGRVWIRRVGNR